MKYQNVILTLDFTLQDEKFENVKCDVNVRLKIKKPRLLPAWLHGVDLTMCKSSNRPIICNTVKYCVKTDYLNGKIPNGS